MKKISLIIIIGLLGYAQGFSQSCELCYWKDQAGRFKGCLYLINGKYHDVCKAHPCLTERERRLFENGIFDPVADTLAKEANMEAALRRDRKIHITLNYHIQMEELVYQYSQGSPDDKKMNQFLSHIGWGMSDKACKIAFYDEYLSSLDIHKAYEKFRSCKGCESTLDEFLEREY